MTTIGVFGAGQLGQMLALAGIPLGLRFRFYDPAPDSPAGQLAPQVVAAYDDLPALEHFASQVDVITYEFENVPVDAARFVEKFVPVFPPPLALEKAQDRLVEKTFFRELGIPTPRFSAGGFDSFGFPAVLKTRRMGYDGKGQFVVRNMDELTFAMTQLQGQDLILEEFVPFEREVSVLAVRGADGALAFYPLAVNTHREGILRRSLVSTQPHPLQALAESHAQKVMEALGYVGVLAIEFFDLNGQLLVNEMAPRVHNSGHWSIEGAETSQFENHVRAVARLPLGSANPLGACGMVNLIGQNPPAQDILKIEGAHLHLYGKTPRPGRKLGHVTAVAAADALLMEKVAVLERAIGAG